MTLTPVLLTLALVACAAALSITGQLTKWSPHRRPLSRCTFFLAMVIGALAVMIPTAARSGLPARALAASSEEVLPPGVSIQARSLPTPLEEVTKEPLSGGDGPLPLAENLVPQVPSTPEGSGRNDGHRRHAAFPVAGATAELHWSLIVERGKRLRSQGYYAQAADTYAEVLVSAGRHHGARLALAKVLLEFGRYKEAELHIGCASAIARQNAGSAPDLALAFSAVAEVREEFASRLAGPLTAVQRQRLHVSEQVRLTAIREASPWGVTIKVTEVREELRELVVEGTLTTDPGLRIRVHSGDRSHVHRSIGEQLSMTIVLTRWPSGREAFDAREVPPGSRVQSVIALRDNPLRDRP